MRTIAALILLSAALPSPAGEAPGGSGFERSANPETPVEIYRIRVENRPEGLVQVSLDSGRTYWTVGRVLHPANARITGFAAASYTPQGTVAAVAIHAIRIKTGQSALGLGKAQMPLMFSIVPFQFAKIPKGYGGHIPRSSAVLTDIDAGHSIFRNQSPYVGSPVYIERSHELEPLPEDYIPLGKETFVITVERPGDMPSSVEFENREGGEVTARYPDGRSEVIAKVLRPVWGVGRYDGTTFTGVGAINTNHGGVITISTAPVMPPDTKEGGPVETRGGFMIQPNRHVQEQNETAPQVMVIGPTDKSAARIEGTPPLFEGYINLSWRPKDPAASYRAQVKIDGGDWEDVPETVGREDDAFRPAFLERCFAAKGKPRTITTGVTAIRILFPVFRDLKGAEIPKRLIAQDLASETADCTRKAISAGAKPIKGKVALAPSKPPSGKCMVTIYVDASLLSTLNHSPYEFEWDSTAVPNGLHTIEIERARDSGSPVVERRVALVVN